MINEMSSPRCCNRLMRAFGFRNGFYQFQCERCGNITQLEEYELKKFAKEKSEVGERATAEALRKKNYKRTSKGVLNKSEKNFNTSKGKVTGIVDNLNNERVATFHKTSKEVAESERK